jgi:hypothetical protein
MIGETVRPLSSSVGTATAQNFFGVLVGNTFAVTNMIGLVALSLIVLLG